MATFKITTTEWYPVYMICDDDDYQDVDFETELSDEDIKRLERAFENFNYWQKRLAKAKHLAR